MIVSVLQFDLIPGGRERLHEVFRRYRILETAITVEGCWALSLSAPEDDDSRAWVIGYWEDRDAYQRWLDHPERGVATEDLTALMSGDFDPKASAQIHEVLHSIPENPLWADLPVGTQRRN
jgi:heme-degrading monooxygenase HmoA